MRRHDALLVALLAATLLSACAPLGSSNTAPPTVPPSGPIATYPGPAVGMDAAVEGALRIVDGCVVIESAGGTLIALLFPEGTADWSDGQLAFGTRRIAEGTTVIFGGGGSGADTESCLPAGCEGLPSFLVGS